MGEICDRAVQLAMESYCNLAGLPGKFISDAVAPEKIPPP
jgi:hypothetical protein